MRPDTIAVALEALEIYAGLRDGVEYYGNHQYGPFTRDEAHHARVDAAIADLKAAQATPQPVPLDFPDSPGWWAFEDERDKFVAHLTIFRCTNDEVEFKFDNSSKDTASKDSFRAMYPGKWYRLHMPWDAPQPQATPGVEPNWADAPPWANWWAQDRDGAGYWYDVEPRLGITVWRSQGEQFDDDNRKVANEGWRGSLQQRPAQGEA